MTEKNNSFPFMGKNLREFNRLFKEFNDLYHEAALKLGLSNSAFDILYAICELGDGCLQRDICKATFIPKQTINSSIRKLEQEGYLVLTPGKGRSMHISLTENGIKLLESTIYPIIKYENEAFSNMTEDECRQLLALQAKYTSSLREKFKEL